MIDWDDGGLWRNSFAVGQQITSLDVDEALERGRRGGGGGGGEGGRRIRRRLGAVVGLITSTGNT